MAYTLDNRAKLRQAFFRLLDTSDTDDALEEQDAEANEAVHLFLMHGLWSAQDYLLSHVDPWRWITSGATVTWSGTDSGDGQYMALPADFLRLAADEEGNLRGLREADGTPWGRLIEPGERFRAKDTDSYYLMNERLYKVAGAAPPAALFMDYHHRHETLTEDDPAQSGGAIDFPLRFRPLIVAWAAFHAMHDAWLPGGQEMQQKVISNLSHWKAEAASGSRRTRQGPRLKSRHKPSNPNFFL